MKACGVDPDDTGREDRRQADGSSTEDGDAWPCRAPSRVHHRTRSRLHTATQRCWNFQSKVLGNLYQVAFGCKGVSGKRRLPEEMPINAASLQCIAAVQTFEPEVCFVKKSAICGISDPAWRTTAAGLAGKHNMITAFDIFYLSAEPLHHPCALMPQNHRLGFLVPFVA